MVVWHVDKMNVSWALIWIAEQKNNYDNTTMGFRVVIKANICKI